MSGFKKNKKIKICAHVCTRASAKPSTAAEQIEKNAARATPRAHCSFNNSDLF